MKGEIKFKIDHDSEEIILKSITSQSNLPILSEESGILGNLSNKFWVVDPLDEVQIILEKYHMLCRWH